MKKLILLITVLSLTSCGLFRKKTKVSNSSENTSKTEIRTEVEEQIQATVKSEKETRSNEQTQLQKDIDEHTTLTADEIEVKPDGSINAKGGAKLDHNKKDKGSSKTNKEVEQNDKHVGHINALIENNEVQKQESKVEGKKTQSQSEPKESSFIYFFIGLSLLACVIIWLIRRK